MNKPSNEYDTEEGVAEDPSLEFVSKMIVLAVLVILVIGMPMAYLGLLPPFLDIWTLAILICVLMFLRRILKKETPGTSKEAEETWEEYGNGRVHEVKNLLMDFQPDQHGGPGGLADYLEQCRSILEETIGGLREKEKAEEDEEETS